MGISSHATRPHGAWLRPRTTQSARRRQAMLPMRTAQAGTSPTRSTGAGTLRAGLWRWIRRGGIRTQPARCPAGAGPTAAIGRRPRARRVGARTPPAGGGATPETGRWAATQAAPPQPPARVRAGAGPRLPGPAPPTTGVPQAGARRSAERRRGHAMPSPRRLRPEPLGAGRGRGRTEGYRGGGGNGVPSFLSLHMRRQRPPVLSC
eukprot:scaffold7245_cov119-Isochrysis_galbana.AAC.5